MSYTHTIGVSYSGTGGTVSASFTQTEEGLEEAEIAFASNDDDQNYAFDLDQSQMKTFWMMATKDCIVEFSGNSESSSSPDYFELTANVPIFWSEGMASNVSNPVTSDITSLYITQSESEAGILYIRALYDPTL